jgi:acyl-CoA carboxylase subunit beta
VAHSQGITAADLLASGAVNTVIPELPDAADEPEAFCARVGLAIHQALAELNGRDIQSLLADRVTRYNRIGDVVAPSFSGCAAGR